jgi:hypothetical protein
VAPPQLARDAPVLDVVQPLVVGVGPVLGHELDLARSDFFQRRSAIDLPGRRCLPVPACSWRRTTGRSASAR